MEEPVIYIDPLDMAIADVNSEWIGISRKQLMENAGAQVASFILNQLLPTVESSSTDKIPVIVFSGTGGNGGDGFVVARRLLRHPRIHQPISVFLVGDEHRIRLKIARDNWITLKKMVLTVQVKILKSSSDFDLVAMPETSAPVIIIDALLGTGVKGKLREPVRSAILKMNEWKRQRPRDVIIVSVDVPSGMNPADGSVADLSVDADWIVALHAPKNGLRRLPAKKILVKDIGIPLEAERSCGPGYIQILPSRPSWSHKGEHGKLWIIGGSNRYSGAPVLSALAAQQVGVDLVTIFAPSSIANVIRSYSPNLIVHPYEGDHLTWKAFNDLAVLKNLNNKRPDAILIGPGCGDDSETLDALSRLIQIFLEADIPLIIDADALKVINRFERLNAFTILTPHAGEFKFITGKTLPIGLENIIERIRIIDDASKRFGSIFVVKGHWDVICGPHSREESSEISWRLNVTGTPSMTVGGTGDVLAGVIASLTAITKKPFHSACLGAYLVGRAGELVEGHESRLTATDVIKFLPSAINESWNLVRSG